MRALLIGLVGVLAVVGGAEAAKEDARMGCKLDGLELLATGDPAFEGESFRVTKVESQFYRLESPPQQDYKNDGYVKILIEGKTGKFILLETYSGWGLPADYGHLKPATAKNISQINPRRRSAAGERARVNGIFYIFDQPFEGVSFFPKSCR